MAFSWVSYVLDGLVFEVDWLQAEWGAKWLTAKLAEKDRIEARTIAGMLCRFPSYCPDDGLYLLGRARGGIERAPNEPQEVYAARLRRPFSTWTWAGTDAGIMNDFAGIGWTTTYFSDPEMVWPAGWPTDGSIWVVHPWEWSCPDGNDDPDYSARWWMLVDGYAEGIGPTTQVIGDGSVVGAGDMAIGLDQPASTVALWRRLVRKWKDSRSTCPGMFIATSAGGFADIIGGPAIIGGGTDIGGNVIAVAIGE